MILIFMVSFASNINVSTFIEPTNRENSCCSEDQGNHFGSSHSHATRLKHLLHCTLFSESYGHRNDFDMVLLSQGQDIPLVWERHPLILSRGSSAIISRLELCEGLSLIAEKNTALKHSELASAKKELGSRKKMVKYDPSSKTRSFEEINRKFYFRKHKTTIKLGTADGVSRTLTPVRFLDSAEPSTAFLMQEVYHKRLSKPDVNEALLDHVDAALLINRLFRHTS